MPKIVITSDQQILQSSSVTDKTGPVEERADRIESDKLSDITSLKTESEFEEMSPVARNSRLKFADEA